MSLLTMPSVRRYKVTRGDKRLTISLLRKLGCAEKRTLIHAND